MIRTSLMIAKCRVAALAAGLLFLAPTLTRAQPYTNLALEGGGIRGIAYAGAFVALEEQNQLHNIRQVAGTSVGAVAGCLLSVGYSPTEITALMDELKFQHFNDGGWSVFGGQRRMRRLYGWYYGDALERWIERQIAAKTGQPNLSFGELHRMAGESPCYKDLYVTASNLSRQQLAIFSWRHFPDMSIATAVRASISIPLYFRALRLDSAGRKSKTGEVYVDGGIVMNFPITIFDSDGVNRQTLGLKLERPEQIPYFQESSAIAPFDIQNFRSFVGALYNLTIETLNRKSSMEEEMFRTIYISTAGVNPRIKKMSVDQKRLLFESGRDAVQAFFRKSGTHSE